MRKVFTLVVFACIGAALFFGWRTFEERRAKKPAPIPPREEAQLTIPEGWAITDINESLKKYDAVVPATIPDVLRKEYPFLESLPKTATLEGYLFPDTYRVFVDELPQALITKQLNEFAKRAISLTPDAKEQGRSLEDIVILASIVEKEVARSEDRAIVAGIFWNRLKLGMPLQSDATVNYITNAGRARPTLKDLEADSLYNTYKYKGLPLGPVSNPGDEALQAVLHPTKSNYYYFLTDDNGKTYFARTFEEHQLNRQRAYGN